MVGRRRAAVNKMFRTFAALAGMLLAMSFIGRAEAAICAGAETVKGAAGAFIGAARNGSAPAFASALGRYTDVDSLTLFALGRYRADLPQDRRAEYVRNAHRYISQFLADNAGRFEGGTELTIESCKGNLVQTSLSGGSDLTWRVSGGRIQDVRVSGVWLTLQLRQKFTNIIRQNHGYVTSLLDFLSRQVSPELRQKKN
jgi:phospholipid transport system substrate-binding protein